MYCEKILQKFASFSFTQICTMVVPERQKMLKFCMLQIGGNIFNEDIPKLVIDNAVCEKLKLKLSWIFARSYSSIRFTWTWFFHSLYYLLQPLTLRETRSISIIEHVLSHVSNVTDRHQQAKLYLQLYFHITTDILWISNKIITTITLITYIITSTISEKSQ